MLSSPSIVVATDFTDSSDVALRAAERLRRITNGNIHAIHVSPYPDQWDWMTNDVIINYYPDEYKADFVSGLNHDLSVQMSRCGVTGNKEVLLGPTVQTILNYVSASKPDLLVLGHKQKGSFLHLKGIAAKVMAGSMVPVLIASTELEIERVAGLIDPYQADQKLFSATEELGYLCSSEVEFISVSQDDTYMLDPSLPQSTTVFRMPDEEKKKVQQKMLDTLKKNADPHISPKFMTEITSKGNASELVRILNDDDIQLAVMSRHQRSKLERLFLGSVTKGVLDHWKGNLLILPP